MEAIYHATRAVNNLTLQHTIAAALTGVTSDHITNITVTALSAPRATNMRGYLDSAEEGCEVHYHIELWSETHTFESLAAELEAAARSGRMNQLLHEFASVFNTTAFVNCTIGIPRVTNLRPDAVAPSVAPTVVPALNNPVSKADGLSDGAVIGIVLGCVCLLVIVLFILYYRRSIYRKRYQPNEAQVVPIDDEAEQVMVAV